MKIYQLLPLLRRLPAVIGAVAALAVALDEAGVVGLSQPQRGVAVIAVAVVAIGDPVFRGWQERSHENQLVQERAVNELLRAALLSIVERASVSWKDVGLNAFAVTSIGLNRRRVLKRIGRERLASSPPPSNVQWTVGKGVVGRCWQDHADVGADLATEFAYFRDLSGSDWDALPLEQRWGLDYNDFIRTKDYAAIVATPMLSRDGRVRGVVSVDSTSDDYDRLWSEDVRALLQQAAQAIENLLEA